MANKNPDVGDKVRIITTSEDIEGILLASSEPGIFLLKLKSGYNIGVKKEDVVSMELLEEVKIKDSKLELKEKKNLPYIDIIVTGGTISSKVDYKTGGVSWLIKPEELFKFYPELFDIVNVNEIKNPFMKLSENMNPEDWKIIAKEVEKSLNNKDIKGIIITHGTDTLHYTSSALSFFLKNLNKPVVLTYAQRSSDRASSDASLNLLCSAHAAVSDIAEVMLVGHGSNNDDFCYAHKGTKVRKMHSSRRDAFRSINDKPLAKIFPDGRIDILNKFKKRNDEKVKLDMSFNKNIFSLKYFPGQDSEIINYLSLKYKGIVIEGTGLGHVAVGDDAVNNFLPAIKKAINNGTIICMTSQTISGKVDEYVYSTARELEKAGVIYLRDMLAETAFVKLGYVLAKEKNISKIKEMMLSNLAGELNSRIEE
jgi:glutamyl-tRNA(Gln) amidotransferase subunit D